MMVIVHTNKGEKTIKFIQKQKKNGRNTYKIKREKIDKLRR